MRAWRVAAPLSGVVLAAALWPATRSLSDLAREGGLGPGFWPRLALLGLALGCLAKAAEEWRRAHPGAATGEGPEPISTAKLLGGIALIVAYAALAPVLGFPLATVAFIVAFMALAGMRSAAGLATSAVLGTVILVYVFVKAVYLPLPKGDGPFEGFTLALYRALGIF
jgi:putative tricarboxylic transport membrane protein